jgi:hypothetical protein
MPGNFFRAVLLKEVPLLLDRPAKEDRMERGITALLSPNEEVTLRRVGLGIAARKSLRSDNLARLIRLQLVEEADDRLVLTDTGRQRYQALPKAPDMGDVADMREFLAVFKRGLRHGA